MKSSNVKQGTTRGIAVLSKQGAKKKVIVSSKQKATRGLRTSTKKGWTRNVDQGASNNNYQPKQLIKLINLSNKQRKKQKTHT